MPIYEYRASDPDAACPHCRRPFEVLQGIHDSPVTRCPECGGSVRKLLSRCRAAVLERDTQDVQVKKQLKEYEASGMWSHAAELADKHSEKTRDANLKARALDDYKRAGYDAATLEKHAQSDGE